MLNFNPAKCYKWWTLEVICSSNLFENLTKGENNTMSDEGIVTSDLPEAQNNTESTHKSVAESRTDEDNPESNLSFCDEIDTIMNNLNIEPEVSDAGPRANDDNSEVSSVQNLDPTEETVSTGSTVGQLSQLATALTNLRIDRKLLRQMKKEEVRSRKIE